MGRGNVNRQPSNIVSQRPGEALLSQANDRHPVQTGPGNANIRGNLRAQSSQPSTSAMSMLDLSNTALSLLEREEALAEKEADLYARRREAAREIRRQRREAINLDTRLGEISSLMADLAQGVLQNNAIVSDHAQAMAVSVSNQLEASFSQLLEVRQFETEQHNTNYDRELLESNRHLQHEVTTLREQIESLTMQNRELATSLARSTVKRSISNSSDSDPTMSWEKRKEMMFAQDQAESDYSAPIAHQDDEARRNIAMLQTALEAKEAELDELRNLLEQRPAQCDEGTTFGAAAIAQLMDNDELVVEERQRLQDLQIEWEAKFREIEIATSIERASFSREHQKLQRRNVELEEQMEHLKQELRQEAIAGPNQSRRWLAKLGLAE